MEGKSISLSTAYLLIGFAVFCGLHSTEGIPSFDPPQPYPAGLKRSADPASLEQDEPVDDPSVPASPPAGMPALNPLLPFIRMKGGGLGPAVDPSQFIQMKADLLKNLFGPGGLKSPVARAVGTTKWASGKGAWGAAGPASAPAAPVTKWAAKSKAKASSTPAPAPAQSNPWSWEAPVNAPVQPAPAPASSMVSAPGYWIPNPPAPAIVPAPGYWVPANPPPAMDKKTVLLEALLDQYLVPASASALPPGAPSRFARAPVADPANPTPSPYLTNLLDSLNLTLPPPPPTLQPTIEPPGFWFPSVVPAPPGSLYPFVVDPSAMVAKKTKFLSDLFASKAAANAAALAALSAPTAAPASGLSARAVEPEEYNTKVAAYLNNILDPVTSAKRAAPPPKSSSPKKSSKTKTSAKAKPTNPPIVESEETPEDEIGLDQLFGLRKKRDVSDSSSELDGLTVAEQSAALLNDMAIVKQNILVQLDAMSKAESAMSKATKLATKAAKKASTIAGILNMPPPPPPVLPSTSLADFQQKIATLTNIYNTLSDTQKNITSAPDANDPFNTDKLFIAAVNAKMNKILMKNALLPTSAPPAPALKVARNANWQRHHEQDAENAPQYESGNEQQTRGPQKAGPLVAAVFAPQSYHFKGEPNSWN